ncbi:phenylalanine--tRNA ligase subunit alpha [Natronorarus salvus]|uniref:phenylalanine--tRNA ligase subunit alpha n=1 Tax=Natronorarus salvus TaxID=3117733 RepID=UPI002F2616A5
MRLPATQVAVLRAASAEEYREIDRIADETGEKPETITGAAFALEEAGLLSVAEETEETLTLTEEGESYAESGLPERRLYETALDLGADDSSVSMGEIIGRSGLEGGEVDIALSNFARKGLGGIDSGELSATPDAGEDEEATALSAISSGGSVDDEATLDALDRRDLIERTERTVRSVKLTDEGVTALMEGLEERDTVGEISSDLLTGETAASGDWETVEFAPYNVEAEAATAPAGRKHVLRQTADRVKDVLIGMGFREMDGPHADADFWINDCLFMPQDHPARTHWDRFSLEAPERIDDLPEDLLSRVESAHRDGVGPDGEGYHSPWSEEMAREIALRGHTTSLSMRYLSGHAVGTLEPPQRYFSVEKVYRNDTLDPTHLLEFFQIEGWVMAEELSVRDLMGTFTEFYASFGITDIQFKPHYNPYTEPSFELFGHHPETGELIEIGNSGMFRPEVLEPLGVECDVMAWGLALERLAMLVTGAEDIRDLHGTLVDIDFLRNAEAIY